MHGALNHGTFDVELVERSPVWAAVGGGLAVQPNVVRALHRIGMGAEVERAATNVGRWVYRTQRGDVLCTVDLADVWSAVGLFVGIERRALHRVLANDAPDAASVRRSSP